IIREKQIKNMNRDAKLKLIRKTNPTMEDLSYTILESAPTGLPQNDGENESGNDKRRNGNDKK
ncbi:MAG: hypothetical protein V1719_00970, partial [Patescibacteria group bacterium]